MIIHQIKKNYWFTLVELIIVISIISILSTIAFLSYSNIKENSRDSKRISDISTLYKWLELVKIKTSKYIIPKGSLFVNNLWYQWYFIDDVKNISNINWDLLDPLDWTKYIYLTNTNNEKLQLWTFLEKDNLLTNIFFDKVYAQVDYTNRFLYTYWDSIWILLDKNTKTPINDILTWSLNLNSYSGEIIAQYNNTSIVEWNSSTILKKLENVANWITNTWSTNTWSVIPDKKCILGSGFVLWVCKL